MKNSENQLVKSDENNVLLGSILEELRPFQKEAFDFATKGKKVKEYNSNKVPGDEMQNFRKPEGKILLADEMGLGKTVSSLAIMTNYSDEWPVLVLCPASLRHTWPSEIEKFLPTLSSQSTYIVGGFDDVSWFKRRTHLNFVIATYSLLQNRSAVARVLKECKFKCIICDESHNIKQRSSQRWKLVKPILQQAKRLVFLSGTPALARPVELWTQLHCLKPKMFGSYNEYTKKFCNAHKGRFGMDVSGLSNAKELHSKLRQVMVRRLKSNVLKELPPKQRSMIRMSIQSERSTECREILDELKETRLSVTEMVGSEAKSADFEAKRLLLKAYQVSGIAKAPSVAQYLLDWLDGSATQKILVFCHHLEVMEVLEQAVAKKFKGVNYIRIDGSVSSKDRAVRVKKFQTHAATRVALLSITAAGVGLTLTAATSVLFAELHWTPGVLAQAEDRCHRIGQINAVNIMYCVCMDEKLSIDMTLWKMIGRKVNTLGKVLDNSKNAKLHAERKDPNQGDSVEEGLVRFFAKGSIVEQGAAVPSKGSIMNYFKSVSSQQSSERSNPTGNVEQSTEQVPVRGQKRRPRNAMSNPPTPLPNIEWACEICTFLNAKLSDGNQLLICEMCGTPVADIERAKYPRTSNEKVINLIDDDVKPSSQSRNSVINIDNTECKSKVKDVSMIGEVGILPPSREIITIDDSDDDDKAVSIVTPSKSRGSFLKFSISKNSSRITIYDGKTNDCFNHNFDIHQVITQGTANHFLDSRIVRSATGKDENTVEFDEMKLGQVLSPIIIKMRSIGKLERSSDELLLYEEVRDFIRNYTELREVEKKMLRESGDLITAYNLKQSVSKQITSGIIRTTERYVGGAKERAIKNLEEGKASEKDMNVLDGRACAWCADSLLSFTQERGVKVTYCSQACAEQGRLKRGGMYSSTRVRAQVFSLEGGVCRKCKIDSHALYRRICSLEPPERLNALMNANWCLPKSSSALERLLHNPREGDFWQADHIIPVAEGGGGCDLDNLQTLCTPCHQIETAKLRSRLRLCGTSDIDNKRKQLDIRDSFTDVKKRRT